MCRTWFSPDVFATQHATLNLLRDRGFPIATGKAQFFRCYAQYTRSDVLLQAFQRTRTQR